MIPIQETQRYDLDEPITQEETRLQHLLNAILSASNHTIPANRMEFIVSPANLQTLRTLFYKISKANGWLDYDPYRLTYRGSPVRASQGESDSRIVYRAIIAHDPSVEILITNPNNGKATRINRPL